MGYKEIVSDVLSILDVLKAPEELREKFIQMREYTLDLREKYSDLNEKYINQKEKITDLGNRLKDKDEMVPEGPYYVIKNDHGKIIGRFCSACHDDKKKKIRLHAGGMTGWWDCPICKTSVTDSTYVEPNYDGDIGSGWMAS